MMFAMLSVAILGDVDLSVAILIGDMLSVVIC
jgi:hypothetical protein